MPSRRVVRQAFGFGNKAMGQYQKHLVAPAGRKLERDFRWGARFLASRKGEQLRRFTGEHLFRPSDASIVDILVLFRGSIGCDALVLHVGLASPPFFNSISPDANQVPRSSESVR